MVTASSGLAQTQMGEGLVGEAANDMFGYAVSLSADGGRLAVGATGNDDDGNDAGHVRVFQWTGATWSQIGGDIDGDEAEDKSGRSVSLSADGSRVAIGAAENDDNGVDSGHVRVYEWSGSGWQKLGSDIEGEAAGDGSGWAVSMSADGSRVAIGATGNSDNGYNAGHVRVYEWTGTAWIQLGADIDGEAAGDTFGWAVSISGDGARLAIGARLNYENGQRAGHVRVYEWSGSAWIQVGSDIDGEADGDNSGYSVALSADGSRVAIGAPNNDGNGEDSGHVRVYQWSGSAWQKLGADINGEAADDQSGIRLSLSSNGNRLAIGAISNDGNENDAGHARVYEWSGTAWEQLGDDIDGEEIDDRLGRDIALSANGNRLAVGATGSDINGVNSGQVLVYELSMFNVFGTINPGLNDAWYNPETAGQGFYIVVLPNLGRVSLAWFTYDTELPPGDAQADLGDPGHRWLTAQGPINGNQAVLRIILTSGGIFDSPTEVERTDPPGSDGYLTLTFDSCNSGTVEYDIPSIGRTGIVPIERIATDNVVLCEALSTQ